MPADENSCAFGLRIANMALHLFNACIVNQGPLRGACFQARGGLQLVYGHAVFPRKHHRPRPARETDSRRRMFDRVFRILGSDRAFNGRVEVGVFENDERRVASEFERDFLIVRRIGPSGACRLRRSGEPSFRTLGLEVISRPITGASSPSPSQC